MQSILLISILNIYINLYYNDIYNGMVQLMYIYWDLIKQKINYPSSCDHTPGADKTTSLANGNIYNGPRQQVSHSRSTGGKSG